MNKILYIFALVASFSAIAQDIIPTIGTELCPNQEYTFTVSGLPGNFINLNSIGSVTILNFHLVVAHLLLLKLNLEM